MSGSFTDILIQLSVVIGILGSAIVFGFKAFKGGARDYDRTTIDSMKSSIGALETERDILKGKVEEQDKLITGMKAELTALHELVTQRADVEKLKSAIEAFAPILPAIPLFQEDHERMLYILNGIAEKMGVEFSHEFISRKTPRPKSKA